MDRLIAEKETEVVENKVEIEVEQEEKDLETQAVVETEKEKSQQEMKKEEYSSINMEYINSFKDMTVEDIKKEEEKKKIEEFKEEKKQLLEKQFEKTEEKQVEKVESVNIIEKPNFDLLEENKKNVKLKKKQPQKKVKSKKLAGIVLACTLGASGIVCVVNCVGIENLSNNYLQIDETYKLNLAKYLKDIAKLDTTKKSMEFIETYPEDLLDAGDLGQKSNWFDRLCNFLGGLFGG